MKFHWRKDQISGYSEWRRRIGSKNDQPGRSAPTLAAAWSGPIELFAAMDQVDELRDFVIEDLFIEEQTSFDKFPGGPRNHDLLVSGHCAGGHKVVISIEAKAGESFGETLGDYRQAALKRRDSGENTNAPERLDGLLARFAPDFDPNADSTQALRYQLFSGLAGTVAAAENRGAEHAVFMIHEFLTDEKSISENDSDLTDFAKKVLGIDLPELETPWCVPIPASFESDSLRLFLAKASTDLQPKVPTPE